jgi:hypothetical protein
MDFINWLLCNCTIKYNIFSSEPYSWTLNKDYENSWDGDDVPLYNSEQIKKYYDNNYK